MDEKLVKRLIIAFLIGEGVATVVWLLLMPPTLLWWKDSIAWVSLMSVWANFAGHLAGLVSAALALYEYKKDHS